MSTAIELPQQQQQRQQKLSKQENGSDIGKEESREESIESFGKPDEISRPSPRPSVDVCRPSLDVSHKEVDEKMMLFPDVDFSQNFQKHETLSETKKTSVLQKQLHKKLLNRLDVAANTVKTMKAFFLTRANIAHQHAQLLAQLPRIHPLGEMGTLETGMEYLQVISNEERELSSLFYTKLTELVEKPLADLYNELVDKRGQITVAAQQHHKDIDTLFEKVSKNYAAFRSCVTDARKQMIEKKELTHDPYLKQVQYFEALNQLHTAQKNYNNFLQQFYEDMEQMDVRRIELLQSLMNQYLSFQRSMNNRMSENIMNATKVVGDINAQEDWGSFQHHKTHGKDYVDILPEVRTKDPGELLQTRSVIRSGHLDLFGKIYFVVLTEFGFFHYFTSPQQNNPEGSIPLNRVDKLMKTDPTHFQFEYTPTGWFTSPTPFVFGIMKFDTDNSSKDSSSSSSSVGTEEADLQAWLVDLRKFVKDSNPTTAARK